MQYISKLTGVHRKQHSVEKTSLFHVRKVRMQIQKPLLQPGVLRKQTTIHIERKFFKIQE
jgi:hypothetical protein